MSAEIQDRSRYNFEAFAGAAEYIEVNNQFIDRTLDVTPGMRILDFGCGTGLGAKRIRDKFSGLPATIVGIDPNPASIAIAHEQVPSIDRTSTYFLEGDFTTLYTDLSPQSIDVAYFLNAIHEIHNETEQKRILEAIFTTLKPGAKLALNSTFVSEWPTERKDVFDMLKLKKGSIEKLGRKIERAETGFVMRPTQYYMTLLENQGFTVKAEDIHSKKVSLYSEAIRAIASYDGFILGTFSDMVWADDVSIEEKYEALQATINKMEQEAIDRGEIFKFNRNWIEIVATTPASR